VADKRKSDSGGIGPAAYTIIALAVIGLAVFAYTRFIASRKPESLALSPEAKQYVRNLQLSDVEMKANESYVKQTIVEVNGKITNSGDRPLQVIEIFCVFYDAYGQVDLRQRVPIVSARMGGLKPGETKSFRLPFDEVPESWNHQLPQLVIAGIKFQ
jgi:hypothetical protein